MTAPSKYLPRTTSKMIAASSIQGMGAQNFSIAMLSACSLESGIAFGPNFWSRLCASAPLRPPEGDGSFALDVSAAPIDLPGDVVAIGRLGRWFPFLVLNSEAGAVCRGIQRQAPPANHDTRPTQSDRLGSEITHRTAASREEQSSQISTVTDARIRPRHCAAPRLVRLEPLRRARL